MSQPTDVYFFRTKAGIVFCFTAEQIEKEPSLIEGLDLVKLTDFGGFLGFGAFPVGDIQTKKEDPSAVP